MTEFSVKWEIDVEADDVEAAAKAARDIARGGTWSSVYDVCGPAGAVTRVDLDEGTQEPVAPTPTAAPAPAFAPPVIGSHHGAALADQLRLAHALIGTDDSGGRQDARNCIDRAAYVSALMLAALKEAPDMATFWTVDGFGAARDFDRVGYVIAYSNWTKVRDAAIAAANGEG